jgi:hypothetical protein
MASLYQRKDKSPFFWVCYKDSRGVWKNKRTRFRVDNPGDQKQAQLLAKRLTYQEMLAKPAAGTGKWEDWVAAWIDTRWGQSTGTTPISYRRYLFRWLAYFKEKDIGQPSALKREHIEQCHPGRVPNSPL